MRRFLCWMFGHKWEVTARDVWIEIRSDYSGYPGREEPYGDFIRCSRCGEPDPLWDSPPYPDEEG